MERERVIIARCDEKNISDESRETLRRYQKGEFVDVNAFLDALGEMGDPSQMPNRSRQPVPALPPKPAEVEVPRPQLVSQELWDCLTRTQREIVFSLTRATKEHPLNTTDLVEQVYGEGAYPTARPRLHTHLHALNGKLSEYGLSIENLKAAEGRGRGRKAEYYLRSISPKV